jgi:ABC-type polysaccharide/polyol phosphate transport system ATPase subunit
MGSAVVLKGVCREFRTHSTRRNLYGYLRRDRMEKREPPRTIRALDGIDLAVEKGERLAVIGNNAAGKTTLLKVISGLLRPTRGEVRVQGEMILLTAFGVGLIEDLTVEDNVYLYGAIYGLERRRTRELLPEIVAWAGVAPYVGARLKTLSSGMRARLAFSVVRHMEADLFLLDETLATGDASFRKKCETFFTSANGSRTIIAATHDMSFVRHNCPRALWLHRGRQMGIGDSAKIVEEYLSASSASG